jgi:hypothetical protein
MGLKETRRTMMQTMRTVRDEEVAFGPLFSEPWELVSGRPRRPFFAAKVDRSSCNVVESRGMMAAGIPCIGYQESQP